MTIDQLNIELTADSKQASSAIEELASTLERLKTALSPISNATKKVGNSFDSSTKNVNKASDAIKKYSEKADKAGKSTQALMQKMAQKISTTRTLISVFQNAARTMADWFNESNEYIETVNLFRVTMGDTAAEAQAYAESVGNAMGIDPAEWMQNQGVFKNLTAGFGVVNEDANVMSQNLTQLSYDMASFFNTDVETAFDKLSSAMSGQVKGLREFGIDTTVASLQEYALANGIDTSVRSMSQAEKTLLRYNYIMEKSTHIHGDMARTIATPANALRVLNAQLTQMKRALGNIISVIVTQFIPYVQALVKAITSAAAAIATFFGFDASKFEADLEGVSSGFAGGFEDAEENLDGVSGAVQKIKKQLMGFDELNIISNPESSGGSSGGASGGGTGLSMPLESYDFLEGLENVENPLTKFVDKIKNVATEIKDLFQPSIDAWVKAFESIDWETIKTKLSEGIEKLKEAFGGFITYVATEFIPELVNTFSENLAPIIADVFGFSLEEFAENLQFFADLISQIVQDIIKPALESIKVIWTDVCTSISDAWGEYGQPIMENTSKALDGLRDTITILYDEYIEPIFTKIENTVDELWAEHLSPLWDNIVESAMDIWNNLLIIWNKVLKPIVDWLIVTLQPKVMAVVNFICNLAKGLGSIISSIVNGIITTFRGIINFLTGVFTGDWDKVWTGIKQIFKGVFDSLYGIVKIPLNLIIGALNTVIRGVTSAINVVIRAINSISFTVPDWVPIIGGETWGPDLDEISSDGIPYLASGGIVENVGQLFVAREAGPELVGSIGRKTAVANNDQIVAGIEGGVYRAMMSANANRGTGGSQTIRIINEIDGDIVGEKVIQYHNGKVLQTGMSPLMV